MAKGASSAIALEVYFESADPRFLAEVEKSEQALFLGNLAKAWLTDPRPAMRRQLLDYLDGGLERANHQPLIKRLFKAAEEARDHEVMAHFVVAADRLVRRELRRGFEWTPEGSYEERLRLRVEKSIPRRRAPTANLAPVNGRAPPPKKDFWGRPSKHLPTFTYATRRYLQRRAWRYFRALGSTSPDAYRTAITTALLCYEDEHLTSGIQLLDAWSLVHILYHHHPDLIQGRSGWTLAEGASLDNLTPAPAFPEIWMKATFELVDLVVRARARTVRLFALHQLRAHHREVLQGASVDFVSRLLGSRDDEVLMFGAELLRDARGLELLPIEAWLKLLRTESIAAAPIVCELFEKHVAKERVSTDLLIELFLSKMAPVARLALSWLELRPVSSRADIARLLRCVDCELESVRRVLLPWLIGVLRNSPFLEANDLRDLLDARWPDVREAAFLWLVIDERFRSDVRLWSALAESPYAEMRAALMLHLDGLERNSMRAELAPNALHHVARTALLAVHSGSRAKVSAFRAVFERILLHPSEANDLIPLVRHLLRSLRAPERRGALTLLARLAFWGSRGSGLREVIERLIPEVTLFEETLAADQQGVERTSAKGWVRVNQRARGPEATKAPGKSRRGDG